MSDAGEAQPHTAEPKQLGRPRRSQQELLDAAAAVFVARGVGAPVRDIAAEAGVGLGTIYRHFPTRGELVVAVYRHQVEACAEAGPRLLAESSTPEAALREWVTLFVDFLVTKHGLAGALQGDSAEADALHRYFVDRLVPVCEMLLEAALKARGAGAALNGYNLLKGVGNLCIGAAGDAKYEAAQLVQHLITGVLAGESNSSASPRVSTERRIR